MNRGNVISRPKITLYGSGIVGISRGGIEVSIDSEYVTLDGESMNAYKGNVLKNRNVTGDLKNLYFEVGKNSLQLSGNVKKVVVEDYSRWI